MKSLTGKRVVLLGASSGLGLATAQAAAADGAKVVIVSGNRLMEGLVRALAVELAPIRVNSVVPGIVKTNLWNSMPEADRENLYKTVGASLPVGRVGEAEDIALTFLYLMKQAYGTGQNIIIDGGAVLV